MRRLWSLVLLAAVAVPAAAQETTPPRERDTTRVREHGFQFFSGPGEMRVEAFQKGRLGILVDLTADPARDTVGARVAGLTPGGAAEKAGVRTGDLVVRLNGTALVRRVGRNEGGDEDEAPSRPGTRLIELASRLEPGDSVRLELRRGTQPVNVTVVAGESGMDEMSRTFRMELPRGGTLPRAGTWMTAPRTQAFTFSGGPMADMELVKVNPGLADYFGTSEGLLVVNVGDDSTFGLKSGDVILTIGGRKPLNPAHALRILGTYEPNESVSFDVMRMKHRATVSGKMPARRNRGWSITPNSFNFDMPMPFMQGMDEMQELPKIMLRRPSGPSLSKLRARVVTT
jgi:membrane-associated protease RseP (regulator of RpoE activity)